MQNGVAVRTSSTMLVSSSSSMLLRNLASDGAAPMLVLCVSRLCDRFNPVLLPTQKPAFPSGFCPETSNVYLILEGETFTE